MAKTIDGAQVVARHAPYNKDPTDFNTWDVSPLTGAGTATISAQGDSVTFARDVPGDTGTLRSYLAFDFGPWGAAGDRFGVVFRVSGLSVRAGASRPHAGLPGTDVTALAGDAASRTISSNGLYGMVVETAAANLAVQSFRLGIGVAQLDTVTDSITFLDVQVTRLEAGVSVPDPVIPGSFLKYLDNQPTLNGAIIGANNDTYAPATGLITESAFTPPTVTTMRHGLLAGDSYVGSVITSVGFRWTTQYPGWIISADGLGGRRLSSIADPATGILSDLLAVATPAGAESPKWLVVTAGGNDMLNGGQDENDLLASDQIIYDWCVDNDLYYVKMNLPPIAGAPRWDESTMRAITDNYNAAIAANPFGNNFKVVDIFSELDDPANTGSLDPLIDSGDGVHPTYSSDYSVVAGADRIINATILVVDAPDSFIRKPIGVAGTVEEGSPSPGHTLAALGLEGNTSLGSVSLTGVAAPGNWAVLSLLNRVLKPLRVAGPGALGALISSLGSALSGVASTTEVGTFAQYVPLAGILATTSLGDLGYAGVDWSELSVGTEEVWLDIYPTSR